MRTNFNNAMKFVFWAEAYRSDTPGDPGGLTIWGYCYRDHPKDVEKMSAMTKEESKEYVKPLYLRDYWISAGCDKLESPLDVVIMDVAVNQGPSRAKTVAMCAANWWDALILRSDLYDDLKLYAQFGKGWNKRRVVALRDYITSGYAVLEDDRKALLSSEKEIKDILPIPETIEAIKTETFGDIFLRILTELFQKFQRKVTNEKII